MSVKTVVEFLTDVKEQKIEQLMGIYLDQKYWSKVVEGKDVDAMRKEMGDLKAQMVLDKEKEPDMDRMDKVNALGGEIDAVEKATGELARLKEMEKGIKTYMEFVTNPDEETRKLLEETTKL